MLQYHRNNSNIKTLLNQMSYIERHPDSVLFNVMEFPKKLYSGKNYFKLLPNADVLVKGSLINIDIEDSNGNSVFYEILPLVNTDKSKTIVVYVYPDNAIGTCTVYISTRLKVFPSTNIDIPFFVDGIDYTNVPNCVWIGETILSNDDNIIEPFYLSAPKITYTPNYIYFRNSSRNRNVDKLATGSLSFKAIADPAQFVDIPSFKDTSINFDKVQPKIITSNQSGQTLDPVFYTSPDKITSIVCTSDYFTSQMKGGILYINGLSTDVPIDALYTSSFANLSVSGSIVEVVSARHIKLAPSPNVLIEYQTVSGSLERRSFGLFSNVSNFTASYIDYSVDMSASLVTQSFATFEITDLEPQYGKVSGISVRYRPVGSFGEYLDAGKYGILSTNLLVDTSSFDFTETGLVYKGRGIFESGSIFTSYWSTQTTAETFSVTGSQYPLTNGIKLNNSQLTSDTGYLKVNLDTGSLLTLKPAEYVLSIKTSVEDNSGDATSRMDVYISGSDVVSGQLINPEGSRSIIKSFGTYIGSINRSGNNTFNFKIGEQSDITPVFAVRGGKWYIADITIVPRNDFSFSPNYHRFDIPLTSFQKDVELSILVDYVNDGKKANVSTELNGVKFESVKETTVQNWAKWKILTSNNSPTGSEANTDLEFHSLDESGSIWSRMKVKNTGEIEQSFSSSIGEHSAITYVTGSSFTFNAGISLQTVRFPIFKDNRNVIVTGSKTTFAAAFQIDTLIYGKTGSFGNEFDTYVWAGSVQSRGLVTTFDPEGTSLRGTPLVFSYMAVSGSIPSLLGTWGPGPSSADAVPKENLDSWFKINAVSVATGSVILTYSIRSTSSLNWDAYATHTCRVIKYTNNFNLT